MFILKKGHQPGVYVPLRALFLVFHHLMIDLKLIMGEITLIDCKTQIEEQLSNLNVFLF